MRKLLILLPLFALLAIAFLTTRAADPEGAWKDVEEAIQKGLPKTAIEHLEPIIERTVQQKKYAEAIKAISMKISLEGNIQGNKPEEKITRMKSAMADAPAEMKPMMQAILGNWYWHYYQQNRWRFLQRTETEAAPGDDFTTWSLPRLFDEIAQHFELALDAAPQLKQTPIEQYDALLEKGTAPDSYRPTLFDFVAYNAIDFYAAGEQAGARSQDAFDLLASSPIFAPVDGFLDWKPETTDEESPTLRVIQLYQELLRFHQDDDDRSAFLDANLARLTFGYNEAVGEEKESRYIAALKRFYQQHSDHPISARAIHEHARVVHSQDDFVQARELALMGMNRFPDSVGGRRCYNLVQQIESKSASVRTERVWSDPRPTIDVTYRNVDRVFFRIVPFDFERWIKQSKNRPENLSLAERVALLEKEPVKEWSEDLEPTDDYQQRIAQFEAPEDLEAGSFFLIASHNRAFSAGDNQVSFAHFWESDLALVIRTRNAEAILDGFVLNAVTGRPMANAKVRAWTRDNRGRRKEIEGTQTDKNGMFTFEGEQQRQVLMLHASHKNDALATQNYYYMRQYNRGPESFERAVFFTDRSLYRPGQTIQYKGVAVSVDQQKNKYEVITGRTVTVLFQDVNGKEIAQQKVRTNDYGSFSGSFNAPRDRLMGRMTIRILDGPSGATNVTVEEYKRPKFQAALDPPREPARLHEEVTLAGKATAYTGAAIDNAQVSWRVVREVRYPIWYSWRFWWLPPQSSSQEIAHGTSTTDPGGSFEVTFAARPDLSIPEASEPTFHFKVYADVTDTTGETRSAQKSIPVGYVALQASLSADSWQTEQDPVTVKIHTSTLDGEGQAAKGTVKIYSLKAPEQVHRPPLQDRYQWQIRHGDDEPKPDLSNPNSWPVDAVVAEHEFETDASGKSQFDVQLSEGAYRAKLETKDRFGKTVYAELPLQVLDPTSQDLGIPVPFVFEAARWKLEPGETFKALWGTGYDEGRAFIEIEHRNRVIQSYWTDADQTQVLVEQEVAEKMRGGFTVRVTMVRENRAFLESRRVEVPWSNKQLTLRWEHFTDKLKPAQQESWTAVVTGPDAEKAVAEMAATLYDASLDAYLPHHWQQAFNLFYTDSSSVSSQFENQLQMLQTIHHGWNVAQKDATLTYRSLPAAIAANLVGYQYFNKTRRGRSVGGIALSESAAMDAAPAGNRRQLESLASTRKPGESAEAKDRAGGGEEATPQPDLDEVTARQNLQETAFFFPHVVSDEEGAVRLEFVMPEALTEWKFMGFAHDEELRSGLLQDKVVTAKDLMVQPNAPRFVREGDAIHFTVKVSNQSPTRQTGQVRLTFADARTDESVDSLLGNRESDQSFEIPSKESRTLSWEIEIPDDLGVLTYKAVGSTGKLSDGEQGFLPVLSRRILVTESLPLPIRGPQTRQFDFERLQLAGKSDTLKHQSLTVQVASNPSWYAVMALPYLMDFPHECTEQTFNRLYANSLARYIAQSDPKIRRIFDQWKGTETLDSPLMKNEDLKAVMIEETPWLRDAMQESEARRNVGILFDDNRLDSETRRLLHKLAQQQLDDGRWPWFPGGPPNDYITLYITTGFGRLRHLGVDLDVSSAIKSLERLDTWADEIYRKILERGNKDRNHLTPTIALYLYGRSFFLEDKPIAAQHQEAVNYWLSQAKEYWLQLAVRQSQGHLAIALKRFGERAAAQGIMHSIKERSVTDEELGMFWRDTEISWWWYRAPIETQALMIEAFDEVMNDVEAVEECKVWLLKQKQTQDWKTTKATADAVYSLLLRGSDVLASDTLVQVSLGKLTIKPGDVEAGTGFYEERFAGAEIEPQMGDITVKKLDKGVAWGSVHWQYLEDMAKVEPYEGTPLKLAKTLYKKVSTKDGPKIQKIDGPVNVGDELVTRVVLRVDRDMEYVHLKDYRGSGTEPVNVLSKYKYQDGLAYYESTRDTASHFFIDYLPKGTYVFEYSVRVQLKGQYQTGIAQIQCMYAPEFNSHSESVALEVE